MKRHRHTLEQAVRKVREGEHLLNDGADLAHVLRMLGDQRGDPEPLAQPVRRDEAQPGQATASRPRGGRVGDLIGQLRRGWASRIARAAWMSAAWVRAWG
jgi:hypothetical protein